MRIISKEEFFQGINFQHNLSFNTVFGLMQQNAELVIQICNQIYSRFTYKSLLRLCFGH